MLLFNVLLLFFNNFYIFVPNLKHFTMSKLTYLKIILKLIYLSGILAIIIGIPIYLFKSDTPFPVKIEQRDYIIPKVLSITMTLGVIVYLYVPYILSKVITNFQKGEIFSTYVIKNLNLIGKLIIIANIIFIVPPFIFDIVDGNKLNLFEGGDIVDLMISVAEGFLFMAISEILQVAKNTKEENDLTI